MTREMVAVHDAVEALNRAVLELGVSNFEVRLHGWGPEVGALSYLRPQGELVAKIKERQQ